MESTREERLQMRQRGAGTRQIKAVDFGFSFGAPAPGPAGSASISLFPEPEIPSQTQSAPAPAPSAATPPLNVSSQHQSQSISQPQRTPGSARNDLPRRPSTYDIPSDERPEEPRSNKRRKINPPTTDDTPTKQSGREASGKTSGPSQNGGSLVPHASPAPEVDVFMPDAPQDTLIAPEPSITAEDPIHIEVQADVAGGNGDSRAQAVSEEQIQSTTRSPMPDATTETIERRPRQSRSPRDLLPETQPIPEPTHPLSKKQRRGRSPTQAEKLPVEQWKEQKIQPPRSTSPSSQGSRQLKTRIPRPKATPIDTPANQPETAVQPDRSDLEPKHDAVDASQIPSDNAALAQNLAETTKKTRGRKGRHENGDGLPAQIVEERVPEVEKQPQSDITQTKTPSKEKRPRGRPSLSGKKLDNKAQTEPDTKPGPSKRRGRPLLSGKMLAKEQADPQPESVGPAPDAGIGPSKPRRGRPSLSGKAQEPRTEPEAELGSSKSRRRPAKRQSTVELESTTTEEQSNATSEPQPEPEQAEPASKARRGRPAKNKPSIEAESTAPEEEPNAEDEPQPDLEHESAPKGRRGRTKKDRTVAEESTPPEEQPNIEDETQPEPEPEEPVSKARRGRKKGKTRADPESTREGEADSEAVQESRKPREPRGETVPVTVHRLFNPSALGAMYASTASDEDEESADELSTRHKTKLPSRGGVNPADVLSQICRETLEKTLTALKNGIANETNAQRRAEWTRKRKAVEAFGSELDGRLLDLSEMLDSNFVLGVQLRKTKRDMMDMRAHLYKVRRERESIALQMDAVRARHMEEENAKASRTIINNSLHSLELALDRSQHRAPSTTEPSSADLEFMLRTVAEDVSCRAPGAQGGLLHQIRAFNAQLETTARNLER
ncbi:hypothetical protein N7520_004997 [Penicillium odoratum]|uniref:uncharacterized protein n=1 Tax=Penicillium odoratum TaxID=1167516 RepID=UPI002546CF0F|nr:uncharacterized protein N7520_004997 [Penicillium odoratum]KAJ5765438.1 hypothetical protein N7520_004997 [Penicillium odoratum]